MTKCRDLGKVGLLESCYCLLFTHYCSFQPTISCPPHGGSSPVHHRDAEGSATQKDSLLEACQPCPRNCGSVSEQHVAAAALGKAEGTAGGEETRSCVLTLMSLPSLHAYPYHACMHVPTKPTCISLPSLYACPYHACMHILTMPACMSLPSLYARPYQACMHVLTKPTCMSLPCLHALSYHACMHVLTMQRRSSQYSPHMLAQPVMSILSCW